MKEARSTYWAVSLILPSFNQTIVILNLQSLTMLHHPRAVNRRKSKVKTSKWNNYKHTHLLRLVTGASSRAYRLQSKSFWIPRVYAQVKLWRWWSYIAQSLQNLKFETHVNSFHLPFFRCKHQHLRSAGSGRTLIMIWKIQLLARWPVAVEVSRVILWALVVMSSAFSELAHIWLQAQTPYSVKDLDMESSEWSGLLCCLFAIRNMATQRPRF